MPVVIEQFEIVRDEHHSSPDASANTSAAVASSSPHPPPLGPVDIDVTIKHLAARALRCRAT